MQQKILKLDGAAIVATASVVGKREHEGPLGACFDLHDTTDRFGKKTWEKSESEMQRLALNVALGKISASERDVDALFAGDLLNQCVSSAYGLLDFDIPYFFAALRTVPFVSIMYWASSVARCSMESVIASPPCAVATKTIYVADGRDIPLTLFYNPCRIIGNKTETR